MRAFVAIELDAELCDALSAAVRGMQAASPPLKLKWVKPEHQHLTLHFFGEINAGRVEEIGGALRRAAGRVAPFDITPSELGCFPNIYKPNVLWVGIHEPSGALKRLYKAAEAELVQLGYDPEPRAFMPHLTLARVPRDAGSTAKHALADWFVRQPPPAPVVQRVERIHLMRSDLFPEGHRYAALSVAPLGADGRRRA
jgi:2'-5' RNA ligase